LLDSLLQEKKCCAAILCGSRWHDILGLFDGVAPSDLWTLSGPSRLKNK